MVHANALLRDCYVTTTSPMKRGLKVDRYGRYNQPDSLAQFTGASHVAH